MKKTFISKEIFQHINIPHFAWHSTTNTITIDSVWAPKEDWMKNENNIFKEIYFMLGFLITKHVFCL